MRRNIRVVILITTLALLICQFKAAASDRTQTVDNTSEMLKVLIDIEVLDEYNFSETELTKNVTRAEYMGIIGNIFDLPDDTSSQVFTDVSVAAENAGYINSAYRLGYISGDGSGNFYPNRPITHRQAIQVLLSAMDYGFYIEKISNIPGYSIANMCPKLASSISYSADKSLSKTEAVKLFYGALDLPVMKLERIKVDKYGEFTGIYPETVDNGSLLTDVLKLSRVKGVVNADHKTNIDATSIPECGENEIEINGVRCKYYGTEDLIGMGVTAYISETDDIKTVKCVTVNHDSVLAQVSYDDIEFEDGYAYLETENGKERKLVINDGVSVLYNGTFIGMVGTSLVDEEDFKTKSGYFLFLDNNHDGKADIIKIVEYKTLFVSGININDNVLIDHYGQTTFEIENTDEWTFIKNNIEVKFERINIDNALSIIESRDGRYRTIIISDKKINGKVSSVKKDGVIIGNKMYKISNYYNDLIENNNKKAEKITTGSCGTFYLDTAGEIVAFSDIIKENYGYVLGKKIPDNNKWTDAAEIKMYTENERFDIFELAEKVTIVNGRDSSKVTDRQALAQIELYDVIKFELNDDKQIKSIKFAVSEDSVSEEVFTKNVTKTELQFHMNVLGARYCLDSNTILFNVPNPDTASADELTNIDNYSTINYFLGNEKYIVDVYDVNEYRSAAVVVNYTDSATGPLPTGYADPFIVSEVCETYMDDDVYYNITGWQGGAQKTLYAKHPEMQQDTSVSNAGAWVVPGGYAIKDINVGDVLQYSALSNNMISKFRVIYRPESDPDTWEKWTNSDEISSNTIRAHMYTACARIAAVNDNQMVIETPTGEKVVVFTNYTVYYLVNTETNEVTKTLKSELHIGDKVMFMMSYSNVYAVIIYR